MDSQNPNPPPKRTRRFLGFARKRATPVEEVHLVHGTGHVQWHSEQGEVPKDIARFEKVQLQLENPVKLEPADIQGSTLKGWNVRYYSPDDYSEKGTGVQHEKAFQLEDRAKLIEWYRENEQGKFRASAESSGQPRSYLQEIREKADGTPIRRQVSWETLLRA